MKKYNWTSPDSIEKWEKYFEDNLSYNTDDFPWLHLKPNYYKALHLYIKSGKSDLLTFLRRLTMPYPLKLKIASAIFYPFAKIRTSLNLFDFPFEYLIGRKLGLLKHFDFQS